MLSRFWKIVVSVASILTLLAPYSAQADVEETGRTLDQDDGVSSPPTVPSPIYPCGGAVSVSGFVPGAELRIYVNGATVPAASGVGSAFVVSGLSAGDTVEATQVPPGGVESGLSEPVEVVENPAFPQTPEMAGPHPLYECGRSVNVASLFSGSDVVLERSSDATTWTPVLGPVTFFGPGQLGRYELTPPTAALSEGEYVRARQDHCGSAGPPAEPIRAGAAPPEPLPALDIEGRVFAGQTRVRVRNGYPGAGVIFSVNDVSLGGPFGYLSNNLGESFDVGLPIDLSPGDRFSVQQLLCGPAGSPSLDATVGECDELPAATVEPPAVGDVAIRLVDRVPGSRVIVLADGAEIGDAGVGGIVNLTRPIGLGETIAVVQVLGECVSRFADVFTSDCAPIRVGEIDPEVQLETARASYELSTTRDLAGRAVHVRGEVHYPVGPQGQIVGGDHPLVLIMHGNGPNYSGNLPEDPPGWPRDRFCITDLQVLDEFVDADLGQRIDDHHLGFRYLATALASRGFIVSLVDAFDLNCLSDQRVADDEGAELFGIHANLWDSLSDGTAPEDPFAGGALNGVFGGNVDTSRTVLIGHSRGGQRVPLAVAGNSNPDVRIVAGIMVAPPELQGASDADDNSVEPAGSNYLLIYGSRDTDAGVLPSFPYYDRTRGLRAQMYLYGANHTSFNTEWLRFSEPSDLWPRGDALTDAEQQEFLRSYVLLFSEWHAFRRRVRFARDVFRGRARVAGLADGVSWPSYGEPGDFPLDQFSNGDTSRASPVDYPIVVSGPAVFSEFRAYNASDVGGADRGAPDDTYRHWSHVGLAEIDGPGASATYSLGSIDATDYDTLTLRVARAARVSEGVSDGAGLSFYLGSGVPSDSPRVGSASIGRIPAPASVRDGWRRTALRTLEIPFACLAATVDEFSVGSIETLSYRFETSDGGVVVSDIALGRRSE